MNDTVEPDALLWRLVRSALKPDALHRQLRKEILESLAVEDRERTLW
jgi:hypothetical protein